MAYTTAKANTTASTTANQIIPPVTLVKHRPTGFAAGKNVRQKILPYDMYFYGEKPLWSSNSKYEVYKNVALLLAFS